ncbi:hypothetical protein SAMN05444392_102325 [Seinonella peptonophila]|uniref:Uncharacterized protein n=1 Tax=Seinonella peptonophila TaxID=112248 RepID=A0A1M4VEP0_9BACL|nr:hypothetical protein [Seinonella peptonophila]SHE67421.1 hypothetical protein SAMN05444392_102325 [Seinonella peptonophila]
MPKTKWHCEKCDAEFESRREACSCEYSHKRMTNFWYGYAKKEEIPEKIVIEFAANSLLDRKRKVTYIRKIELF